MSSSISTNNQQVPVPNVTDDGQVVPGGDPNVPQSNVGPGQVVPGAQIQAKQDPFGEDQSGRKQAPSAINGNVANAQPYDQDYGAIKQVFDQAGFQAPTEAQLRQMEPHAQNTPAFNDLVQQVKTSVTTKDDSKLPAPQQYLTAYNDTAATARSQREAQQAAFNDATISKMGQSAGDEDAISKMKNPAAIVMLVMLQAKKEITQQKKDDLSQLQKYSTISDLMNNQLNSIYLPAQQEMNDKVAKAKDSDGRKQTVEVPNYGNTNFDNYIKDDNGQPQLQQDLAPDKNGDPGPETVQMHQGDLNSKIQEFQNQMGQVSSRVQREQTNYQGHDSQDSTLSNIITATQKTFADSSSAILRNIQ